MLSRVSFVRDSLSRFSVSASELFRTWTSLDTETVDDVLSDLICVCYKTHTSNVSNS